MIRELRGLVYLSFLTIQRQLFTRKSILVATLVGLIVLGVYTWSTKRVPDIMRERKKVDNITLEDDIKRERPRRERPSWQPEKKIPPKERILLEFSNLVVMDVFLSGLVPLLTLIYATSAFGDEREDRTLVYLLTRPLGRWRIYLAKGAGVVPVAMGVVLGSFYLICLVGGEPGQSVFLRFLPGLAIGTLAYTVLFLLFGAVAPRPLIMSVVYAFLVETIVGNMPGSLKRMAISYHTRCLLFNAGADIGVAPENPRHFVAISPGTASLVLWLVVAFLLLWGCIAFQRREYRDLA